MHGRSASVARVTWAFSFATLAGRGERSARRAQTKNLVKACLATVKVYDRSLAAAAPVDQAAGPVDEASQPAAVVEAVGPPLVGARAALCVRFLFSRDIQGDRESEGAPGDSPLEALLARERHKEVECSTLRSPTLNQKMPKTVDSNWCETCRCLILGMQPEGLLLKEAYFIVVVRLWLIL